MKYIENKQSIENAQFATARWGDPSYIARRYPYSPGTIWLGRNPHNEDETIGFSDDRHIFLCAGTRTGKGRAFIINNLLKWPGSIVSVDPKGENATVAAIRRGSGKKKYCDGMKQDTYVLDPMRCANVPEKLRAHYNLLDALDPEDRELLAKSNRIADAICIVPESGDAADWAKLGKEYISSIIAHLVTYKAYKKIERNLVTVCRLIMEGEVQGAKNLKEVMNIDLSPFDVLLEDMMDNAACNGWIASMARSIKMQGKKLPKYFESVRSEAITQTKFLTSPGIEDTVSNTGRYKRTFDITKLEKSKKGISIFLCLPLYDADPFARWQRAMIAVIMGEMQKKQGIPANGHQVLLSIDEFQSLGKMEPLERAVNEGAGAGVKLMICTQNIGGVKKLYGENWETFLSGSGLQIFFGADGPTTQKYLEDSLGQTEIVKDIKTINVSKTKTETEGETKGTTHTKNTSKTKTHTKNRSKSKNRSKTENWNLGKSWSSAQSISQADTWNRGNSSSKSQSINQADTWNKGDSSSKSQSINQADTWNRGSSSNKSQAYNETENWNNGINWSDSKNYGQSEGKQAGKNYGPHIFFRGMELGNNESSNSSRSEGTATSKGGTLSEGGGTSRGTTDAIGENASVGGTTTRGTTDAIGGSSSEGGATAEGETDTIGEGESIGLQTGSSDTTQNSTQTSHANAYQIGGSVAKSFYKKPLLAVNEVNEFLASPQERDHVAYPGMALIRISEELPFFLRKSNYDQDPEFARCFDPNPAYEYTPVKNQPLLGYQYTEKHYLDITIPEIMIDYGYYLTPVIKVKKGQNFKINEELFSYKKPLGKWKKLETPFDGKVISIAEKDQYKENGYIMTVRYDFPMSEEDKELLHDYFWEKHVRLIIDEFTKLFIKMLLTSEFLRACKEKIERKKTDMFKELKWKLAEVKRRNKKNKETLHKLRLIEEKLEKEKTEREKAAKLEEEERIKSAKLAEYTSRLQLLQEKQKELNKMNDKRENKIALIYLIVSAVVFFTSAGIIHYYRGTTVGKIAATPMIVDLVVFLIAIPGNKLSEFFISDFYERNFKIERNVGQEIEDLKKEFAEFI
ncbi:MAG: type IV secretory system conjugative DNA transfer family protein [Planctomycetes bacterium]|nr:type IV secretory system conjugative DNA transfer family protein [Planctomycetota bacterium]